jgi:pSer/pThr/pTyr-binding forkhead associated (FHA) protein
MGDHRDDTDGPLWADGDMMFRVSGAGAEPDRLVKVRHPYAVLGRADDADIAIDDRAVSARHAYLHLDPRGVYAVDLVTRTGTRINGTPRTVGWLRPGDWLEVAGRRVELLRVRIDGAVVAPPPCDADLLADTGGDALAAVTLEPHRSNEPPWVLSSELVFLGWSASCCIQVKDASVARTHCVLVRSASGAYLVDLCGRQTWVEDVPVRGAAVLHDGDLLTIGTTQFGVRVEPPGHARAAEPVPRHGAGTFLARVDGAEGGHALAPLEQAGFPINADLIPAEARGALVAWVMGTIQGGQGEVIRRQGEFQLAMTQVLRQIQQDNAALLNAHLSRIEGIDRELAALRAEIERRHAAPPPRVPPNVPPLRVDRAASPEPGTPESKASTNWLLHRVSQLEDENRSAWKDLLGRLSQARKAT